MLSSVLSSVQTLNVSKDLKQGEMKPPPLSPHKNPLVPVTSLFTDNRKHLSLNGQESLDLFFIGQMFTKETSVLAPMLACVRHLAEHSSEGFA